MFGVRKGWIRLFGIELLEWWGFFDDVGVVIGLMKGGWYVVGVVGMLLRFEMVLFG